MPHSHIFSVVLPESTLSLAIMSTYDVLSACVRARKNHAKGKKKGKWDVEIALHSCRNPFWSLP
jgi:hypothetical protein